jgi:hypothetical protein
MNARADVAVSRKERLRTLEAQLREDYEAFVRTGFALKEIRDDHLYEEAGFDSWERYLKDRVGDEFGIERRQAFNLIAFAQIRLRLPDPPDLCSVLHKPGSDLPNGAPPEKPPEWSQRAVLEFRRLAPKAEGVNGQPYDLDKLHKGDVERVAGKVIQHCQKENVKLTAPVVRKFVDKDLGIDRVAQAAETRQKREEQDREMDRQREEREHPDISQHLIDRFLKDGREAERVRDLVKEIGEEAWGRWKYDHRGLIVQVLAGMTTLTDLYKVEETR